MVISSKLPLVVLVEDDPTQSELIRLAIGQAGLRVDLMVIDDGLAGFELLSKWAGNDADPLEKPALVLLDIKLPGMSGVEILTSLQEARRKVDFPIVMLTTSNLPDEMELSFGNGAGSYFVKPLGFLELVALMDTIGRRWLDTSRELHGDRI